MLSFNPETRISAQEAILDPYFDDVRIPEQEIVEKVQIDWSFEEDDLKGEDLKKRVIEKVKKLM